MLDNNISKEVKVGIVFFLGLILLIFGLVIGKGFKFSSDSELLKIRFQNSGGLQVGEPVVVNGVKRGSVLKVLNNNSSVLVFAKLDDYSDIKSDAVAKITILEITGGKKVEIFPGKSNELLSIENEMRGETPPDLPELIRLVGEVSGDAVSLVRKLDTIASSGTELFADGKFVEDIKSTLQNANDITASLKSLINDNQSKLQNTIDNLSSLIRDLKGFLNDNKGNLSSIINNADTTLQDSKILIKKLDITVGKADSMLVNINGLVSDIKHKDGLTSKLIYDKDFATRLDSTFVTLFQLIDQIRAYGVNVNVRLGSRP